MNKKLKRQIRHKAAISSLFSRGNIIVAFLLSVVVSSLYTLIVDSQNMTISLSALLVAMPIFTAFIYLLGMFTYSDIVAASVSMQCRIQEKLLNIEITIKDLEEKLQSNPAPKGFLDEREADLYDAKKEKERLLNLFNELERVPFEFN